jgi:hypothetical protein
MTHKPDLRIVEPVTEEIGAAANIRELSDRLSLRLPAPGRVADLNVFCGHDTRGQMLCLVDVQDIPAGEAARALDGVAFAFTSVVLELTPGPAFCCRMGRPENLHADNCTCGTGQGLSITRIDL